MSDFKFSCPRCEQHIACDESYYGVQINCPTCRASIGVPIPAGYARRELGGKSPPNLSVQNSLSVSWARPAATEPSQARVTVGPRKFQTASQARGKSWLATFLLALFLGGLGIDRFYNGRTGLGIGKLLTGGLCGLWSLIDVILLLTRKYEDAKGNHLVPAKKGHLLAALSITALMILVNVAVTIAAVQNIRSESASLTAELKSAIETTPAGDDRDPQMLVKAGVKGKGASSPAEAFAGFQRGMRAKEYSTAFSYLTPEGQTSLLGMTIGAIAMQKALKQAFNSGAIDRRPAALAARREAEAKENKIAAILQKHNVSLKPGEFSEATVGGVKNKGQCFHELAEILADEIGLDEMASGNLTALKLNKDTAIAQVNGETIKFKRLGNTWFMDLEGIAEK